MNKNKNMKYQDPAKKPSIKFCKNVVNIGNKMESLHWSAPKVSATVIRINSVP